MWIVFEHNFVFLCFTCISALFFFLKVIAAQLQDVGVFFYHFRIYGQKINLNKNLKKGLSVGSWTKRTSKNAINFRVNNNFCMSNRCSRDLTSYFTFSFSLYLSLIFVVFAQRLFHRCQLLLDLFSRPLLQFIFSVSLNIIKYIRFVIFWSSSLSLAAFFFEYYKILHNISYMHL